MNSTVVVLYAWGPYKTTFDTQLVQVLELSGVSSNVSAVEEVKKLGFEIQPDRCRFIGTRQATPGGEHTTVFAILLTPEEISGRTVRRVGDMFTQPDVHWAMVGVIMAALLCHQVEPLPSNVKRKRKR